MKTYKTTSSKIYDPECPSGPSQPATPVGPEDARVLDHFAADNIALRAKVDALTADVDLWKARYLALKGKVAQTIAPNNREDLDYLGLFNAIGEILSND